MFVLLVIPIVGGFLAGLFIRSRRVAMVVTGVLWVIGSALLVGLRVAEMRDYAGAELNVNIWIGVVAGLLGFVLAWAGNRIRARRSATG